MNARAVVVRKTGEASAIDDGALEEARSIEASLLPPSSKLLRDFPVDGLERQYLRHLEQRIHRNPRDLLSHVRRLLLNSVLDDGEGVYGALVDLFIVLGYRGRPLRNRLLGVSGYKLTSEQRRFLEAHLEDGLEASDVHLGTSRSCLSQQVSGKTSLVVRSGDSGEPGRDLLDVAMDALARGEDDAAQELLEGALEADPGSEPVCIELLALYKRRNSRDDFMRTYTAMLGRELARPDLWQAMAARINDKRQSDERI